MKKQIISIPFQKWICTFIFGLILIAIGFIFNASDIFEYERFVDRDLFRALDLSENFQIYGPETNLQGGNRIPGGASYYILYIFFLISQQTDVINQIFLSLTLAGFIALACQVHKSRGLFLGLATLLFFLNTSNIICEAY